MSNNYMRRYIDIITEMHRHHMYTKDQCNYTDHARGLDHCASCQHFIGPDRCDIVIGNISPRGWCKFYHPKG